MGDVEETQELLDRYVIKRPGFGTNDDETRFNEDCMHLEAAILAGCKESAGLLYERFINSNLVTTGIVLPTCVIRLLGGAASLLERYDDAKKHYQEAIKACTEMRYRPEIALSRLELAELILDHYPEQKAEALEHLNFAIKEFREMKMQPSLERTLRRKDILKA